MSKYEVGQMIEFDHDGHGRATGIIRQVELKSNGLAVEVTKTEWPMWIGHGCGTLFIDGSRGWWVHVNNVLRILDSDPELSLIQDSALIDILGAM